MDIVPVVVIGPPVRPPPVLIEIIPELGASVMTVVPSKYFIRPDGESNHICPAEGEGGNTVLVGI